MNETHPKKKISVFAFGVILTVYTVCMVLLLNIIPLGFKPVCIWKISWDMWKMVEL